MEEKDKGGEGEILQSENIRRALVVLSISIVMCVVKEVMCVLREVMWAQHASH